MHSALVLSDHPRKVYIITVKIVLGEQNIYPSISIHKNWI